MKPHEFKSMMLLGLCLVLLVSACWVRTYPGQTAAVNGWGLSFPEPGQAPVIDIPAQTLEQYDAVYLGDSGEKVLYLTFDAGYENGCTAQILDVLQRHQAPAAFFLVGNYMEKNPELVQRMCREGHIVGNHTYHHRDMSQVTDPEAFRAELEPLEELYHQITGEQMSCYYRPPEGNYTEQNLRMAQELGYRTVFWSLAYQDWNNDAQPTDAEAFDKLIPRVHNGAVVLLHSTSETNARILDELLTRWEQMGYRFETLDRLYAG